MHKRMVVMAAVLGGVACSGGDKDTDTGAPDTTCDSLVRDPLGTVPSTEWPDSLSSSINTYLGLDGRYEVNNSCGDDFAVKVTLPGSGTQEDLDIVTTPWDPQLICGCSNDPSFDPDSKYDHIAMVDGFQFFIEDFGEVGIDNSSLEGLGVIFDSGEPLLFRSCAVKNIDPVLNSQYEQLTAVFRLDPGGALSGTLVLVEQGGATETCDLTGFSAI